MDKAMPRSGDSTPVNVRMCGCEITSDAVCRFSQHYAPIAFHCDIRLRSYPDCLRTNTCGKTRLSEQCGIPDKIDFSTYRIGKLVFKAAILKKPNAVVELHQKVHVAVRAFLFAGDRTEDPKLLGLVPSRDCVDFIPLRVYGVKHAHRHYYSKSRRTRGAKVLAPCRPIPTTCNGATYTLLRTVAVRAGR